MLEVCKISLQRISKILPPDRADGDFDYSAEDIDFIRAYYLLAHAEIETYIEGCLLEIVNNSYLKWKNSGDLDDVLLSLVIYYHPAVVGDGRDRAISTIESGGKKGVIEFSKKKFERELERNNRIRSKSIEKMLKICGFDLLENSSLLPDLESFSKTRGRYAHDAHAKQHEPPKQAKKSVEQIIFQLENLEALRVRLLSL